MSMTYCGLIYCLKVANTPFTNSTKNEGHVMLNIVSISGTQYLINATYFNTSDAGALIVLQHDVILKDKCFSAVVGSHYSHETLKSRNHSCIKFFLILSPFELKPLKFYKKCFQQTLRNTRKF